MERNKKNALKLFEEFFGEKAIKAKDFSGREIAKSAYDDRNSNFGWNIDHILPISKGGTNSKNNLIPCHILTNDEKADKTTFTANNKNFQVKKKKDSVGYEIVELITEEPTDFRKKVWQHYFSYELEATDFAGRDINYNSNDWDIQKFQPNLLEKVSSYYIAHKDTLSECTSNNGNTKTNFTSNNTQFLLKKIDGIYRFVAVSDILDNEDYANIHTYIVNQEKKSDAIYKYFDVLRIKVDYMDSESVQLAYINTIRELSENVSQFYHMKVFDKTYYGFTIDVIFQTPQKGDVCEIHELVININTLSRLVIQEFDIDSNINLLHCLIEINPAFIFIEGYDILEEFDYIPWYYNQFDIYLTDKVKKYLIECNYDPHTFKLEDKYTSLYSRDYVRTKFLNYIESL